MSVFQARALHSGDERKTDGAMTMITWRAWLSLEQRVHPVRGSVCS